MYGDVHRRSRRFSPRPPRVPSFRDPAHADLWTRGFDDEVHQPTRFLILSLLRRSSRAGLRFGSIQTTLRLTHGNLGAHLARLERLEHIVRIRDIEGRRHYTVVRLTATGREAYDRHVDALRDLILGREDHGG